MYGVLYYWKSDGIDFSKVEWCSSDSLQQVGGQWQFRHHHIVFEPLKILHGNFRVFGRGLPRFLDEPVQQHDIVAECLDKQHPGGLFAAIHAELVNGSFIPPYPRVQNFQTGATVHIIQPGIGLEFLADGRCQFIRNRTQKRCELRQAILLLDAEDFHGIGTGGGMESGLVNGCSGLY